MNQHMVKAYSGAVSNTKVPVDGTSCRFAWISIGNNNAAVSYVQIWNLASGDVTVGSTAPLLSIEVPANSGREIAPGTILNFGGSGFTIAATTGRANSTAPSTAVDVQIAF